MSTHEKLAENTSENEANQQVNSQDFSQNSFEPSGIEAVQMKHWQEQANQSSGVKQFERLQQKANSSSSVTKITQLQKAADSIQSPQTSNQTKNTTKENKTGLPDTLKSGIEALTGHAMDDVKVHYNSDKPAQLQAHAYAQGTEIHLASNQEKHLAHEAWHVVQQKQGRVKPTKQLKKKVNINDDTHLEKEADVMGAKALKEGSSLKKSPSQMRFYNSDRTAQRVVNNKIVLQRIEYDEMNQQQLSVYQACYDKFTKYKAKKKRWKDKNINNRIKKLDKRYAGFEDIVHQVYNDVFGEDATSDEIALLGATVLHSNADPNAEYDQEALFQVESTEFNHAGTLNGNEYEVSNEGASIESGGATFGVSGDGVSASGDIEGIGESSVAISSTGMTLGLFGQSIFLGKDKQSVSGSFEDSIIDKKFEPVSLSFDIPLPVPVPVYISAGLSIFSSLSLSAKGGYELSRNENDYTANLTDGALDGNVKLGVTGELTAGAGVANIAGIEGGGFIRGGVNADATGNLSGGIKVNKADALKTSNINVGPIEAASSIFAKIGAKIKAKLLMFSKGVEFSFLDKELALFNYERPAFKLEKVGANWSDIIPKISDFRPNESNDILKAEADTTPLLGDKPYKEFMKGVSLNRSDCEKYQKLKKSAMKSGDSAGVAENSKALEKSHADLKIYIEQVFGNVSTTDDLTSKEKKVMNVAIKTGKEIDIETQRDLFRGMNLVE